MKKNYFLLLLFVVLLFTQQIIGQVNIKVNQVLIASGGNFTDPDDYVTIASYNPNDSLTTQFGTILTQSVQSTIVYDHYLYVTAQDSIAVFDIDTYKRCNIIFAQGVNRLFVTNDKIIASFWYPATSNFVKIYKRDDLSLISEISEVSDEAAGIIVYDNKAFVAVPGSYAATTGKLAIIDLESNNFIEEIDLGEEGARINDLYFYEEVYLNKKSNYLISINKSAWGSTNGYIMKINLDNYDIISSKVEVTLGKGAGIDPNANGTLFAIINNGIGAISLNNLQISDTSLVEPLQLQIADATYDFVNKLLYVTTTDYATIGEGIIFNLDGDIKGNFQAGISAEAIAIDYRNTENIIEKNKKTSILLHPNPVINKVFIENIDNLNISSITIFNLNGKVVLKKNISTKSNTVDINMSDLKKGIYIISVVSDKVVYSSQIVKQ
jgi:hypothetical protein